MIKNYVITSAGRSGCHLVVALIKSCGKNALHTHDPFFNPSILGDPDGNSTALILLQRKDLFSSIMSMLVGKRTNQWSTYPNKVIPRFRVECNGKESEFAHQYSWHKNYIQSCKTLENYQQVKLLEFEEVVNDFNYVFQQLELTQLYPLRLPEKAPYSYLDIIENIDECKLAFNQLEVNYTFTPIMEKYDPNRPN
jgi:hypothetical protein